VSPDTHGDWFDQADAPTDVHRAVQRPISVAQLLKREGHDTPTQQGMTRRTLTGVAAGAVMVFSAAVGSLLLHHGDATTGNVAAGSGSGDVLAADGTVTSSAPGTSAQPSTQATTHTLTLPGSPGATTSQSTADRAKHLAPAAPATTPDPAATDSGTATSTGTTAPSTTQSSTQSSSTGSTDTGASTSTTTTTANHTPTSTPSTSTGSTAPTTTSSSGGSSSTTPPTTTSSSGGVVGTVTGVLGDVTAPVFSWFGG
jgi:hypothetical protein